MAKLSFLDKLNEQQLEYATKIAEKAQAMGVPPKLAVSIAYQESRLNPNVKVGTSGEIGIMQVMPTTGETLGYDTKALTDPDANIDAGLKYLKKSLDATGGDHKLATIGYNAGINAPFFTGGNLPESTAKYVKDMRSYGAYDEPDNKAAVAEDTKKQAQIKADEDAQERRMAQVYGAGTGMVINPFTGEFGPAAKIAGRPISSMLQGAGAAFERGRQSSLVPTEAGSTRIQQGTTVDDLTGKARMGMLEDTAAEAARRKVMAENLLGMQQSGTTLKDATQLLAEAPGMTSTPSGIRFPTTEAGFYRAPPKPTGLEQVNTLFKVMMRPIGALASTAGKYVLPPLALASAAGEGVNIAQQLRKPEEDRDLVSAALSAGNILGSGMSMYPPTAPVGIPLMLGTGAAQYYRQNDSVMNQLPTQPLPIPRIQPQMTRDEMMQQAIQKSIEDKSLPSQGIQQMQGLGLY